MTGHDWYVHRNIDGGWEWSCSCGGSGVMATEDAACESGYRHEGTDRSSLLAEVERLRAQRTAVLAIHHREDGYVCGGSCAYCRDSDEDPVKWPCPTAQALGVTA